MGKLIRAIRFAAILLFVGLGLALVAFSLPFTGWKALSVQTGSMEPAIAPGSLVFVHRVSADSIKKGDVITYKSRADARTTITHRVVERTGNANGPKQTILQGDANKTPDAPVYDNQVVGRVTGSAPYAGRLLDFLKTPWGLALLIYIPIILIFISEVRLLVRRLTKLELEKQKAALHKEHVAQRAKPTPAAAAAPPAQAVTVDMPVPHSTPVHHKKTPGKRLIGNMSIALVGAFGIMLVAPTLATLETEASLTQNVISSAGTPPPATDAQVLLERIVLPDKKPKHAHKHWKPEATTITLYSTKRWKKVDAQGWTLESSAGVLYRFEGNKWKHWDERTKHIKITKTLSVSGDFVVLKNANGGVIDSLSWGNNTSQLNPAVQGAKDGSLLKRIRHNDTNSAADWKVRL